MVMGQKFNSKEAKLEPLFEYKENTYTKINGIPYGR